MRQSHGGVTNTLKQQKTVGLLQVDLPLSPFRRHLAITSNAGRAHEVKLIA